MYWSGFMGAIFRAVEVYRGFIGLRRAAFSVSPSGIS